MKNYSENSNFPKGVAAVFGIYVFLFAGLYYSPFSVMVQWWKRDDYSYCYLIPFIVLYLLWEKRHDFSGKTAIPDWKGIVPLIIGISFYWLGELGGEFYIIYLSSWIILLGICILTMGVNKVKTIIFSLCFILTMFPFPNFINNRITLDLKLISSKLGVMIMQTYGMSAFREGNVIDLGFTKLQVVDACSGLRYFITMIVLSILIAYFYKGKFWKKAVIVLSSIPLSVFANALRIAMTGVLAEKFGLKVVEGFFHDFEGLMIFMITIGVLMMETWLLNRLFPESRRKRPLITPETGLGDKLEISHEGGPDTETDYTKAGSEMDSEIKLVDRSAVKPVVKPVKKNQLMSKKQNPLTRPQFIVSVILLGFTLVLSKGINFRGAVPISRPFNEFPIKVGEWTGTRQVMENKFILALDFSDYIMTDYTDKKGHVINFYVAYYETQSKGESIHSPATCLRGGGWVFKQAGRAVVKLNGNKSLPVSRALIQKGDNRQLSYYWFPMRGRVLTNAFQMKWYTFWDALTKQRTDGALVRAIAPVGPNESLNDVEKRLQSFIREISPVLSRFLPGK